MRLFFRKVNHFKIFMMSAVLIAISSSVYALSGTVRVDGRPQDRYVQVPQSEWKACGGVVKKVEDLIVGPEGQLKNAVVWVEADFTSEELNRTKTNKVEFIDQKQCDFVPRIVTIPLNGRVVFRSSDMVRHGVAGFMPSGQNQFDYLINQKDQTVDATFTQLGPHPIRCGFHQWMAATVFVQKHPFYAVTDNTGRFELKDLPRKKYTLHVWHERMGLMQTEVAPGQRSVELTYQRPGS